MFSHDTHAHVFDLALPFVAPRRYTPKHAALPEDYLMHLDQHSLQCGWLIQPSFLGYDNSYIQQMIRKYQKRFVGVAVIDPALGPGQIETLDKAGFVGIRLNLDGKPMPDFAAPAWRTILRALRTHSWHVEIHCAAVGLGKLLAPLIDADIKVVVDHFGRPDTEMGVEDPGFRNLLDFGSSRKVWVKLSASYRNGGAISVAGAVRGEAIAKAACPLLLAHFGMDRLVWGSDWPHTRHEAQTNFDASYAALECWIPDAPTRASILCQAPSLLLEGTRALATISMI